MKSLVDAQLPIGSPRRLLVVAAGNTTNTALLSLFETHSNAVTPAFEEADFVELGPTTLVQHPRRPSA